MDYLFWHLRSEGGRLRGHAAVGQDLTVLPEKEEETDEVKSCAANPENRNLLTPGKLLQPFEWYFLELRVFHVIDDLLLGSATAERKAGDERQMQNIADSCPFSFCPLFT